MPHRGASCGTHQKHLTAALLMSTHNICLCWEIRKTSAFFKWKKHLICCYVLLFFSFQVYKVFFFFSVLDCLSCWCIAITFSNYPACGSKLQFSIFNLKHSLSHISRQQIDFCFTPFKKIGFDISSNCFVRLKTIYIKCKTLVFLHFMQTVSLEENLQGMSNPIFWKK